MNTFFLVLAIIFVVFNLILAFSLANVSSQAEKMAERIEIINCSDMEED